MSNEINNEAPRYEIVLLEDDPETLNLIKEKLEARGIIVHAYARGDEALQKILDDPNIGALVTDIEIRYPYPNGTRNGSQGYDVANKISRSSPDHLLSIIVLTALEQEQALDSVNLFTLFNVKVDHYFSKWKWTKLNDSGEIETTFDALGMFIKEYIELSPQKWADDVRKLYPRSRWVCAQKDGQRVYPPYWDIYRKMWFSRDWKSIEQRISEKATEIVESYRRGEFEKLRGGRDRLTLTENPNEMTFQEHLSGRRVVYALKALEPAYWENMVRGERTEEEERAELTAETWGGITTHEVKNLVNDLNKNASTLRDLDQQLSQLNKQIESFEKKASLTKSEEGELEGLQSKASKIRERLAEVKKKLQPLVNHLMEALKNEPEEVQNGFVPYLRFLNADFTNVDWAKKTSQTGGGKDPLTQTLLLLGIRKQDIEGDEPENWKLLLPEEGKWLISFFDNI